MPTTITLTRRRYGWNRFTSIAAGASMLYAYQHRQYLGWDTVILVGGAAAVSALVAYVWLYVIRPHRQEK